MEFPTSPPSQATPLPHNVNKERLEVLNSLRLPQLVSLSSPFLLMCRATQLDLSLPLLQTGLDAIMSLPLTINILPHTHTQIMITINLKTIAISQDVIDVIISSDFTPKHNSFWWKKDTHMQAPHMHAHTYVMQTKSK